MINSIEMIKCSRQYITKDCIFGNRMKTFLFTLS